MKFGDSLDMRCATLAIEYETYLRNKKEGGTNVPVSKKDYSTEDLQAMVTAVKEQKHGSNSRKE